jgi:predicted secreted hydrolase
VNSCTPSPTAVGEGRGEGSAPSPARAGEGGGEGLLLISVALIALLLLLPSSAAFCKTAYPPVLPGVELQFPRDEGSHPDYRLEWWYVTGWLEDVDGESQPRGFQVTFFRVRTGLGEGNPSAFAARQVLFAHAAMADPTQGKLRHAQRSARTGFDLVYAREGAMQVRLDDWSLQQVAPAHYRAVVKGDDFEFSLELSATQAPMLQGERGYSRKGPDSRAASYYYSLPQLVVSGEVAVDGKRRKVRGHAWFDHEWSSDYVDTMASGWDWLGINLNDGGALMAFRMRDTHGRARWASATVRPPVDLAGAATVSGGSQASASPPVSRVFSIDELVWAPLTTWESPRTGVLYPIQWRVRVGDKRYRVEPLIRDAELDSRATTGILYWEGPVWLLDDETGVEVGRGYLEMTGYGGKLDL